MNIRLECDLTQSHLDLVFEMMREIEKVPGIIVEIGSWKCGTSGVIAATLPQRKVYAFDLFGGLPPGVPSEPWEYFAKTDWDEIQQTVRNFPNLTLIRGLHEDTVPEFAKTAEPIALLFMDSDHYSSHKISLKCLSPLMSPEGVILFHDWHFAEVQMAIQETMNIDEWLIFDGHDTNGMGAVKKREIAIHK